MISHPCTQSMTLYVAPMRGGIQCPSFRHDVIKYAAAFGCLGLQGCRRNEMH